MKDQINYAKERHSGDLDISNVHQKSSPNNFIPFEETFIFKRRHPEMPKKVAILKTSENHCHKVCGGVNLP